MTILGVAAACIAAAIGGRAVAEEVLALNRLDREELAQRVAGDTEAVLRYRAGLERILVYMKEHPELFPEKEQVGLRVLDQAEREVVRRGWASLLDYYLALDSIGSYHSDFFKLKGKKNRGASFAIAHGAFLAGYRFALELIDIAERDPNLDTLLNDAAPELGLGSETYTRYKVRYLNLHRAAEFAAMRGVAKLYGQPDHEGLWRASEEDAEVIWEMGKGRGELLTGKNALNLLRRGGMTAWFPVQKGVAEWMGTVKVWRWEKALITTKQARALLSHLHPGDVFVERREWHLTNVGIPGFWTHMALFIGTPEERRGLAEKPEVRDWVRTQGQEDGDLEGLLSARYPENYARSLDAYEDGNTVRVLEAIAEGVTFTSLEKTAHADSIAALRPRLSMQEKAEAIVRAFRYAGRPYDYNFDFRTDTALVCSELVYKCYEKGQHSKGLRLPVAEVAGRPVMPPNTVIEAFSKAVDAERQFDFVVFLDGYERGAKAIEATLDDFCASWQRPKWHVFTRTLEGNDR